MRSSPAARHREVHRHGRRRQHVAFEVAVAPTRSTSSGPSRRLQGEGLDVRMKGAGQGRAAGSPHGPAAGLEEGIVDSPQARAIEFFEGVCRWVREVQADVRRASLRSSRISPRSRAQPHKPLTEGKKRIGGRNNHGRMTVRLRGGGHKRRYRDDRLQARQARRARARSRPSSTTRTARPHRAAALRGRREALHPLARRASRSGDR